MFRTTALAALGAASLLVPAAAAQPYGQPYSPGWQGYGQPRGDYDDFGPGRGGFGGYPQFRGIEEHIRQEIREGVREDLIEREDARDLFAQLRDIRYQEAREFREHGWNLPARDRYRLQAQLQRLDARVDQVRAEPED